MQKRWWLHILFMCYLAVLLRITVFRTGFGTHSLCVDGTINLKLFEEYIPLIQSHDWDRIIYLFVGNIIWFVPLGMYVRYRKSETGILRAVIFGLLLSLCIEIMQFLFGTGISELDDLILNTLGAVFGALSFNLIKLLKSRLHR